VKALVFERYQLAGAASGKAGGFLAGGWGDGGVTEQLHRVRRASCNNAKTTPYLEASKTNRLVLPDLDFQFRWKFKI
jgi:hypothetical protein